MRRILPLKKPAEYMARCGIHPHIGHEIDVAKAAAEMASRMTRFADDVAKAHDADLNTNWREYAKTLASRIRAQRGEIDRLHKQVRELRADVHERDERIRELEA